MTNKIIEAAREAGIEFQQHKGITGKVNTTTRGSQPIEKMAHFYAIAFAAGMERAAEIADESLTWALRGDEISDRILAEAHAQKPPKNEHDSGDVSKN